MKKVYLLCTITVGVLAAAQQEGDGQIYKADRPYITWLASDICSKLGGHICLSMACAGEHYVNEFCCCDVQYTRERPAVERDVITAYGINPNEQSTYYTIGSSMGGMMGMPGMGGGGFPGGGAQVAPVEERSWMYTSQD